jgi:hypothetical protein
MFQSTVKKLKLKLNYEAQSVGQSVLVSDSHLGPATNFSFSLKFFFRQLRVCYFVAPSLTRGRVCNLVLLLVLASAVPRDSKPYFIVPIHDFSNLEGQVPVFISPRDRVASYDSQGLRWRYCNPPPHGMYTFKEML